MKLTRRELRKLIAEAMSLEVTPGRPDPNPRIHFYNGHTYERTSTKVDGKEGVERWEGNNKKYTVYPRYDTNISSKAQLEILIDNNRDDASKAAEREASERTRSQMDDYEARKRAEIERLELEIESERQRLTPEEREAAEKIDLGDLDPNSPEMIEKGRRMREKFANKEKGFFSRFFEE